MDLSQHLEALKRYFASLDDVVLAYLFGSHARGQAGPLSDVDFAVLLAGRPNEDHCFDMRLELIGGLMGLLHTNEVDVLILNQASPALRYAVLRDGILIFCRDAQARIEFRVRTINEYLDLKPMLKRHGDAILEKARKGELLRGHDPYQGALERYRQLREIFEETGHTDLR
ncbi:MAG: type VII toxin-antitoxin system MntA family adenylyltransferase antitoxin [Anaerolineae bacterium]